MQIQCGEQNDKNSIAFVKRNEKSILLIHFDEPLPTDLALRGSYRPELGRRLQVGPRLRVLAAELRKAHQAGSQIRIRSRLNFEII